MGTHKFFTNKKPAQAMAEFAIALPVLLLLLYGIIEAGRLLFLYSTVVTASRQAVRYGATTGDGGGSTPVYGAPRAVVPRYRDCAGIRGAANRAGFLSGAGFDSIVLKYDTGPTTAQTTYCGVGSATEVSGTPTTTDLEGNSARLEVTVTENFVPLVPKLVPFAARPISATAARTILYSVPIVVTQPPMIQNPTTLTITSDNPDPSSIGETVTVTVSVVDQVDAANIPEGTVEITGGDLTCTLTLSAGLGTCTITFSTPSITVDDKTIVAVYHPSDTDHLTSTDSEGHTVLLWPTTTTIISDAPDPSIPGQSVMVAVTVTGGTVTPAGTVTIDAGGGITCSITLAGGAGSCSVSFSSLGAKTITATYAGDANHQSSVDTEGHNVLQATPTPTATRTATPIATLTPIPTATLVSTPVPTRVTSCTGITHSTITTPGSQMTMTVTNPFSFPLIMRDVTVTWNDDKGHEEGSKKLRLQIAAVNGVTIWTGNITNRSTYTISATPIFPPGTNTITFTFDQSYDIDETSDRILINWLTPGCEGNPVNSAIP